MNILIEWRGTQLAKLDFFRMNHLEQNIYYACSPVNIFKVLFNGYAKEQRANKSLKTVTGGQKYKLAKLNKAPIPLVPL